MDSLEVIRSRLITIEHGFRHIQEAADELWKDLSQDHFALTRDLLNDNHYQIRMLGTVLLGKLAPSTKEALYCLKNQVSQDENWRVQEMLAKAFDHYCDMTGYENALPTIQNWMASDQPNIVRAVTEGLRIWTSRSYFRENPLTAIELLSEHHADESEYVRKSVGNALRDIRKKHQALVDQAVSQWDSEDKRAIFTKKLIEK